MSGVEDIIGATTLRCDLIVAGVDDLEPVLDPIMPLSVDGLAELSFLQRTVAIAYLKRFEQFQDILGRLGRAIVSWEGGDPQTWTQRDLANWLERIGAANEAGDWMEAVRLRNRLVHEYPIEESEQIARVNACRQIMDVLRAVHNGMNRYLNEKGLK